MAKAKEYTLEQLAKIREDLATKIQATNRRMAGMRIQIGGYLLDAEVTFKGPDGVVDTAAFNTWCVTDAGVAYSTVKKWMQAARAGRVTPAAKVLTQVEAAAYLDRYGREEAEAILARPEVASVLAVDPDKVGEDLLKQAAVHVSAKAAKLASDAAARELDTEAREKKARDQKRERAGRHLSEPYAKLVRAALVNLDEKALHAFAYKVLAMTAETAFPVGIVALAVRDLGREMLGQAEEEAREMLAKIESGEHAEELARQEKAEKAAAVIAAAKLAKQKKAASYLAENTK